jgi:hypothetical protein
LYWRVKKRRRREEGSVKCINGVKEEMAEDFRVCKMLLQNREPFDQLYERGEASGVRIALEWTRYVVTFPAYAENDKMHPYD